MADMCLKQPGAALHAAVDLQLAPSALSVPIQRSGRFAPGRPSPYAGTGITSGDSGWVFLLIRVVSNRDRAHCEVVDPSPEYACRA